MLKQQTTILIDQDKMAEQKNGNGRRVLMLPLPLQGHINPMFQLASILHSRGFAITVLHTHFNSPDPTSHPEYQFVLIDPDGVSDEAAKSSEDILIVVLSLNVRVEAQFRERLAAVLRDADDVACLVVDPHWRSMQMVAEQLGVPTIALRTGSATCFTVFTAFPMLCEKGYLPRQESQLEVEVAELPPLRVRDILYVAESTHDRMSQCTTRAVDAVRSSSGLILNTFDALENNEIEKIKQDISVPVFSIGPLHKLAPATESSLIVQDRSCLEWLDHQDTKSVIYVSFGSLAFIEAKELFEIARGLADSGHPFLWVVRSGMVRGSKQIDLPDGFKEETQDRGRVVSWAPQKEVLAHKAIGGFWTHNGWNSTLESLCEGVPMICMPYFADQMMNARYVEAVWHVGFELDGELERARIETAVRKLMKGQEGMKMRERASELKRKATECIGREGSSTMAIDKLVDHILLM